MTKTTKKILMFGIPIVLIGGFFIYKALRPKKPIVIDKDDEEKPPIKDETKPSIKDSGECKKYKVVNVTTWLNIRKSPSVSSSKQGSIPNTFPISAKPSNTEGWMELCEDGGGFVSLKYLKESK